MAENKLTWMIGGKAGYGIMVTGMIFSKSCVRGGLHVFDSVEYPSLIRGGHNTYHVRVEEDEIHSHIELIDILVALNKETVDKHKDKVTERGAIIYDSSETEINEGDVRKDIRMYDIPLLEIAKEHGNELMMNTVALGATMAIVDYDLGILEGVIKDEFSDKGKDVVNSNIESARDGYNNARANYNNNFRSKLSPSSDKGMILLTGNDAIAMGAIRAGCRFYSAYPMTPASSILHYMAAHELSKGVVVKQTEDEISAIHTAIGASFAGARAMTATSGGGFCLMSEGLGLAALTETPLVIALCQRAGPSTGLATRTEQADLRFAMHASQGEFPRVIMAPGDVEEAFTLTAKAFNLAEKYQIPVIVMSDKHLSESHKSSEKNRFNIDYEIDRGFLVPEWNDGEFRRFMITDNGVSPRALPGQEGTVFRTSSYERDEYGWNSESPENRTAMNDKRIRKTESIISEIPDPSVYGPEDADITLIAWGSTKGAVLEAMKFLEKESINANFIHITHILPFKAESVRKMLESAKKTLIVEQNHDLQLGGIIMQYTGVCIDRSLANYTGRQVLPHEIYDKAKEVLAR
ncbi:2-oxoacid:acceptor oxidoreductase subunit alpha [Candidatus Woesearchaeota archaeon]|nr:2-oxoacid:acceptor oxidoreductase subunit alpha [Candidatus Woesearchaeota archaeon]